MIRTLIVDDEEPTRARLRQLLAAFSDIEVAGEAEDGEQAMERILELRPDLLFLDIQMPGCSGIELASSLPQPRPRIVFCTAFDQYAVDAFELHAVDYLLKPVNRVRLAHTIERVRALAAAGQDEAVDRAIESAHSYPARFLGKRNQRYRVVPQADVVYLGSDGGLTKLYTAAEHYVMEPTLNDFERRLDPAVFFRISRAAIVNLDYVTEVIPLTGGSGEVALKNGARLEVSRRRLPELLDKLAGVNG